MNECQNEFWFPWVRKPCWWSCKETTKFETSKQCVCTLCGFMRALALLRNTYPQRASGIENSNLWVLDSWELKINFALVGRRRRNNGWGLKNYFEFILGLFLNLFWGWLRKKWGEGVEILNISSFILSLLQPSSPSSPKLSKRKVEEKVGVGGWLRRVISGIISDGIILKSQVHEKYRKPKKSLNVRETSESTEMYSIFLNTYNHHNKKMLKLGVNLDLNLSFLVTVNVAILSFTRFVPVSFRDLLTRNPIPNCLFPFLSRNRRLEGLFLFSSTECYWFLNSADVIFFSG